MSFSSDVVKIDIDGEVIAEFFESEIPVYQSLYDKFKDYFTINIERWYDTDAARSKIEEQFTICMAGYYVHEDGWHVWVNEREDPIIIPLSEIPSTEENHYTLRAKTILALYDEPSRYKSWVYKNSQSYVVTLDEWAKALSYFPKKHNIHTIDHTNLVIFNSY